MTLIPFNDSDWMYNCRTVLCAVRLGYMWYITNFTFSLSTCYSVINELYIQVRIRTKMARGQVHDHELHAINSDRHKNYIINQLLRFAAVMC